MTNIQKKFGDKLRKIRLEKNLTQEELADKANLHPTYIGQAERGLRNVTLNTLCRLAQALKIRGGKLLPF